MGMLEIALHNPRQHCQFVHARGPLLLARCDDSASVWIPVDGINDRSASAHLEILPQSDGVVLAATGFDAGRLFAADDGSNRHRRLPVPAMFYLGDTRFEIFDTSQLATLDDRPLQKLHPNDERRDLQSESGPSSTTVSRWFAAIGSLNRWATSLQQLYAQAVKCAV